MQSEESADKVRKWEHVDGHLWMSTDAMYSPCLREVITDLCRFHVKFWDF